MTPRMLPFGPGALTFIGLYLLSLLAIGWIGYRARREDSMRDFFLANRGIGFVVLVLTLYATQYSGNTLFGFTGRSYRYGYFWMTSLHFMTAIVVFYLLFAPKLQSLAKNRGFITPTDFLDHRFASPGVNLLATIIMIVAISNYLIGQLKAMGHAFEGLTGLDDKLAYCSGVMLLAAIIIVYETLGGFRAVVWTDAIQGLILIFGFAILVVLIFKTYGSLATANDILALRDDPESLSKIMPPSGDQCRQWISYVLLVGIGGALYPQAIQRIYAARSASTLRRSLAVMAFLPLTTALVALIVGIIAAAHLPAFEDAHADRILAVICQRIQQDSWLGYWLVVVLFAAILAAIMSTADSVLLSISSMVTKDIYGRFVRRNAEDRELTRFGKRLSWVVVAVVAVFAILLRERTDLVKLLDRKFDLLVQLAPAFFIGVHWSRLRAGPVLAGMVAGVAVALVLAYGVSSRIWGFHPGLIGLLVNVLIAVGGSFRPAKGQPGKTAAG